MDILLFSSLFFLLYFFTLVGLVGQGGQDILPSIRSLFLYGRLLV